MICELTDEIAMSSTARSYHEDCSQKTSRTQYLKITSDGSQRQKKHELVVGSKARILYADEVGRRTIATEFNAMQLPMDVVSAPIVLRQGPPRCGRNR